MTTPEAEKMKAEPLSEQELEYARARYESMALWMDDGYGPWVNKEYAQTGRLLATIETLQSELALQDDTYTSEDGRVFKPVCAFNHYTYTKEISRQAHLIATLESKLTSLKQPVDVPALPVPTEGAMEAASKWFTQANGPTHPDVAYPIIQSLAALITAREAAVRDAERQRGHDIALAIDSGRGNEKEIAAAIRAGGQSNG